MSRLRFTAIILPLALLALAVCAGAAETTAPSMLSDTASALADTASAGPQPGDTVTTTKLGSGISLFEKLKQGGIIVVILFGLSVALLSILLERLVNLQRSRILPANFTIQARALWEQKDYNGIKKLCDDKPSTIARVARALVTHRTSSALELSTLAGDIASQDMRAHVQKLVPFALIAAISPLLGLLGTVSGMIESFEVVAVAGSLGDASLLADGIAKALVTTAVGLVVAVPAIACFNLLKSRTNKIALMLDYEANLLISEWFMEQADDSAAPTTANTDTSDSTAESDTSENNSDSKENA